MAFHGASDGGAIPVQVHAIAVCAVCKAIGLEVAPMSTVDVGPRGRRCPCCASCSKLRAATPTASRMCYLSTYDSFTALRQALADDEVEGTAAAMRGATASGLGHDVTPILPGLPNDYLEFGYLLDHAPAAADSQYTVFHHAVHLAADEVARWAIQHGADALMPSSKASVNERAFQLFGFQVLVDARRVRRRCQLGLLWLRHAVVQDAVQHILDFAL